MRYLRNSELKHKPFKNVKKNKSKKALKKRIEYRKQWIAENYELSEILRKQRVKKYLSELKKKN